MIKQHLQQIPIIVNPFSNHLEIKQAVLDGITTIGTHSLVERNEKISNSDWHLNANYARPYAGVVQNVFEETFKNISETFNYGIAIEQYPLTVSNFWFQQYEEGDYHGWHTHPKVMFSNVYYVELNDENAKTTFFIGGQEVTIDVKEGDIITFPSFLMHCSKPNTSSRKTVIAFNI